MTVINTQYLAHMSKYANAVYGGSLLLYSFVMMRRVWLNSYLESNAHSLMQQINRNLRETRMKDYNQLKVGIPILSDVDHIAVTGARNWRKLNLLH